MFLSKKNDEMISREEEEENDVSLVKQFCFSDSTLMTLPSGSNDTTRKRRG